MTQAIKSKKNNDFPSTGIMEKYLNGTQNTRFKICSRVTILQTCVGKLHATHREPRETEAEKNVMFPTEHREREAGISTQALSEKQCQQENNGPPAQLPEKEQP